MNHNVELTRRAWLRGAGLGIGGLSLAACSSSGSGSQGKQAAKAGTLTVMTVDGEITSAEVKAFQAAYPDLKLQLINSDPTRLNSMLAAGSPPDLVRDAGTDVTPYIATRQIATNLDDYIKSSKVIAESDIMPINDVWKWDGTKQGSGSRYGLAKDWSQDSMWWYDTEAWANAGLTAPSATTPVTYDELLDSARKLTMTKNGKTSVYGLFTTTPRMDTIASMVATAGGRVLSDDLATADFSSPEGVQAITWYVDVAKAKVGYTLVDPSPDWDGPEYFAGRQVSAQQGYWFGGYLKSTEPSYSGKTQFAPAPLLGSTRVSPSFGAVGYWIPTKAKNPGGAFQFIEWYCAGAGAKTRAAGGNGLPSMHSLLDVLPNESAFDKSTLAVQNNELQYLQVLPLATPYALGTALDASIAKVFPSAVNGGKSAGQIADALNDAVNAVLANGKKLVGK